MLQRVDDKRQLGNLIRERQPRSIGHVMCGDTLMKNILAWRIQELSYRQQNARQLCTQYAEGIYRLKYYTVTLKCKLRVTQGHWKRNHWIDHTRLSSSRVTLNTTVTLKCGLEVTEGHWKWYHLKACAVRFLFAFYSNCGRIYSRLWDIQCQRMAWPWKPG